MSINEITQNTVYIGKQMYAAEFIIEIWTVATNEKPSVHALYMVYSN